MAAFLLALPMQRNVCFKSWEFNHWVFLLTLLTQTQTTLTCFSSLRSDCAIMFFIKYWDYVWTNVIYESCVSKTRLWLIVLLSLLTFLFSLFQSQLWGLMVNLTWGTFTWWMRTTRNLNCRWGLRRPKSKASSCPRTAPRTGDLYRYSFHWCGT